jgi:hypothetical protein
VGHARRIVGMTMIRTDDRPIGRGRLESVEALDGCPGAHPEARGQSAAQAAQPRQEGAFADGIHASFSFTPTRPFCQRRGTAFGVIRRHTSEREDEL